MENKNTLLAVALIAAAFFVFNSPAWYHIWGEKHPTELAKEMAVADSIAAANAPAETLVDSAVALSTDSLSASVDTTVAQDTTPALIPAKQITLENKLLTLTLSEAGAVVTSAKVKAFLYREDMPDSGQPVELLPQKGGSFGGMSLKGESLLDHRFTYDAAASSALKAVFTAEVDGELLTRTFELPDSSYYATLTVTSPALKEAEIGLLCPRGINESEFADNKSSRYSPREVVFSDGKKTKVFKLGKKKKESYDKEARWLGVTSKYFGMAVILPQVEEVDGTVKSFYIDEEAAKLDEMGNMNYDASFTYITDETSQAYTLFFGPTKPSILKEAKVTLQRLTFRGWPVLWADSWFPMICEFVVWAIGGFHLLIRDYGVAIILITVVMRLVTFPLTQSSMKSMEQMKTIQPKIKAIQDKYKSEPQVMQAKMMEFYQTEGVSPLAGLGGCLPMFLQMPIMISLFVVLRKAVELRGETTWVAPWLKDLSQPEVLFTLPFEIPFYGSNVAALPILMAVLMFFQNKATMKDPSQQAMIVVMPVVMLVMFNNFPSGLTLYFVFSNLLQMLQQRLVTKQVAK